MSLKEQIKETRKLQTTSFEDSEKLNDHILEIRLKNIEEYGLKIEELFEVLEQNSI
jgi:L-lactate utilization protein LutB